MKQVLAWKCSGCGMTSLYKGNVKRHEKDCWKIPENKHCKSCEYFKSETEEVYTGHQFGEATFNSSVTLCWCNNDIELKTDEIGLEYELRINCEKHKLLDSHSRTT